MDTKARSRLALVMPALGLAVVGAASSCGGTDLPPCDNAAAQQIVFLDDPSDYSDDDGLPMTAGQAVFYQSCGGTAYCHAYGAKREMRCSVPRGLDWDLAPPCRDDVCAADDPERGRFVSHRADVLHRAHRIWSDIESGAMPPGAVGHEVARVRSGEMRVVTPGGALADGPALPRIDTAEGRKIVGNWLACGAPVVETALLPDATHAAGDPCDAAPGDEGSCVTRMVVPYPEPPRPEFGWLFEHVFGPSCATANCHDPGAHAPIAANVRFGSRAATYELLTTYTIQGQPLVVARDRNASLLPVMLSGGSPTVRPMPASQTTHALPAVVVEAIAQWIDDGASMSP